MSLIFVKNIWHSGLNLITKKNFSILVKPKKMKFLINEYFVFKEYFVFLEIWFSKAFHRITSRMIACHVFIFLQIDIATNCVLQFSSYFIPGKKLQCYFSSKNVMKCLDYFQNHPISKGDFRHIILNVKILFLLQLTYARWIPSCQPSSRIIEIL